MAELSPLMGTPSPTAQRQRRQPSFRRPRMSDSKKPSEWRYLGKPQERVDIPAKVTGKAQFGIDVDLPGMVYRGRAYEPISRRGDEVL